MNALTRSLAVELATDGIRVNTIVCGMVLTSEGAFKMMDHPVIGGATRALHLTRLGIARRHRERRALPRVRRSRVRHGREPPGRRRRAAKMAVPDISAADLEARLTGS